MSDLLENLSNQTPSEMQRRSVESMRWFTGQLRKIRTSPQNFYKYTDLKKTRRYLDGRMYMFFYEAKWQDKLPYWDAFPCVIILDTYQDGFLGLNLHYLHPRLRARLMDALYTISLDKKFDEDTRIRLSYEILNKARKFRFFKPCVKRYLVNRVRSRFVKINADQWDTALFLPTERFRKKSKNYVFRQSREMIGGV